MCMALSYFSVAILVSIDSIFTTFLTVSWILYNVTATEYTISYSNTDCPTDTYDDITGISPSETMYRLTDLQEGTDYSIIVAATLNDGEIARDTIKVTTTDAG